MYVHVCVLDAESDRTCEEYPEEDERDSKARRCYVLPETAAKSKMSDLVHQLLRKDLANQIDGRKIKLRPRLMPIARN